jgi:hypothetical protein
VVLAPPLQYGQEALGPHAAPARRHNRQFSTRDDGRVNRAW